MLRVAKRSRRRRSWTRWFLLCSLLLHLLALVALNVNLWARGERRPTQQQNPIRVSFVPPEKVEESQHAEVFAEASSRAQSPDGPKGDVAKDTDTVLPGQPAASSEPTPPARAQTRTEPRSANQQPSMEVVAPSRVKAVAKPAPERPRQQDRSKSITQAPPEPQPTPLARPKPARMAELPESADPAPTHPPLEVEPLQQASREAPPQPEHHQPQLFGRIPLLSGEDLEKYAQVRTSDQRSSAGETVSLETKELKYLAYFAHIKRRIERVWTYPPDAVSDGIHGQLQLKFVLHRNGEVKYVELLRSSGFKVLDKEAWDAVINAGPFDAFPPMIPEDELHISARFTYLLDEARRRTSLR